MTLPVDHLSASSVTTFLRCPRQWQDKYIMGNRGPSNSALVLGSYVHLLISKALTGQAFDSSADFNRVVREACEKGTGEIVWKDKAESIQTLGQSMFYEYYETVGKHLNVESTETEIGIDFGADIPLIGFVDIVCPDRIIDVKTTGYFSPRQVRLNPEWRLQAQIYQMHQQTPAEFHVITRAKTNPIAVPSSPSDALYVPVRDADSTKRYISQVYSLMNHCYDQWGDDPWPGGETHEWALKFCPLKGRGCCQES